MIVHYRLARRLHSWVELREAVGKWLLERRNARLRAQREEIEARVKSMLPPAQPLNPEEDGAS